MYFTISIAVFYLICSPQACWLLCILPNGARLLCAIQAVSSIYTSELKLLYLSVSMQGRTPMLLSDFAACAEQTSILKLAFKRKGGWIYLRKLWPTFLTFRFGYSHPVRFSAQRLRLLRYKKYLAYHVLLVTGLLAVEQAQLGIILRDVRVINPYTQRGIRLARQQMTRRQGKESQYKKLKSKIF